jgi:hypothetical protein
VGGGQDRGHGIVVDAPSGLTPSRRHRFICLSIVISIYNITQWLHKLRTYSCPTLVSQVSDIAKDTISKITVGWLELLRRIREDTGLILIC